MAKVRTHGRDARVAMRMLDEPQGKVRFGGFTGHKNPALHLRMLSYDYPFDTVQQPLNCFDATFRSFEQQVLPELLRRGIAPIGMKSMGGEGDMVKKKAVTAQEALGYVAEQASDGRFEPYKTTAKHEAKVGRAQHGFPPPTSRKGRRERFAL